MSWAGAANPVARSSRASLFGGVSDPNRLALSALMPCIAPESCLGSSVTQAARQSRPCPRGQKGRRDHRFSALWCTVQWRRHPCRGPLRLLPLMCEDRDGSMVPKGHRRRGSRSGRRRQPCRRFWVIRLRSRASHGSAGGSRVVPHAPVRRPAPRARPPPLHRGRRGNCTANCAGQRSCRESPA